MKLSVYRARMPRSEMEHGTAIKGATTEPDVDLIMLAMQTNKATLIGLDGQSSIIKTYAQGDEAQSFESLYDTCLTLGDMQQMQRAGVSTPEEIPPNQYRVQLHATFESVVDIAVVITATNHGDVRTQARDIFTGDSKFREALFDAFIKGVRQNHNDLNWSFVDIQQVEPINPPDRRWSIPED